VSARASELSEPDGKIPKSLLQQVLNACYWADAGGARDSIVSAITRE
jgi:hypothetical protein